MNKKAWRELGTKKLSAVSYERVTQAGRIGHAVTCMLRIFDYFVPSSRRGTSHYFSFTNSQNRIAMGSAGSHMFVTSRVKYRQRNLDMHINLIFKLNVSTISKLWPISRKIFKNCTFHGENGFLNVFWR